MFTACRKPCWKTALLSTVLIMMLLKTVWKTSASMLVFVCLTEKISFSFSIHPFCRNYSDDLNMRIVLRMSLPVCRYSAIHCASAVPMSPQELQQEREAHRAPIPEPEQKKSDVNRDANVASKPSTKPQKGIMGMFANKSALKSQDSSKDNKSEQKEEVTPVRFCFPECVSLLNFIYIYLRLSFYQVDPPKNKSATKTNPMSNFFGTQTTSESWRFTQARCILIMCSFTHQCTMECRMLCCICLEQLIAR